MGKTYFDLNRSVAQGDRLNIPVRFYNSSGAIDISSDEFFYTAKKNADDVDNLAVIALDPADIVPFDSGSGTVDKIIVCLTSAITGAIGLGEYYNDIQWIRDSVGEPWTIGKGILTIEWQVTERTS